MNLSDEAAIYAAVYVGVLTRSGSIFSVQLARDCAETEAAAAVVAWRKFREASPSPREPEDFYR